MVLLLFTAPYSLILLVALRLSRNIGNLVLWGLTFFSPTNKQTNKRSLRSNPKTGFYTKIRTVGNIGRFSSRKKTTSLFFPPNSETFNAVLWCCSWAVYATGGRGGAWIHLIQSEKTLGARHIVLPFWVFRPWLVKRGSLGCVLHVNSTAWLAPVLSVIVITTDMKP